MFRLERRTALAAALCLLLAVIHTWPLATSPGTLSRNDNADAQLNEWILAWVAHQLPRSPAQLFDSNIFYPSADTLAFSEPLIAPALMGAPLQWLGARRSSSSTSCCCWVRADGVGRLYRRLRMDRRPRRRPARRLDVRVQHAHDDAAGPRPGHPRLGPAAGAAVGRSTSSSARGGAMPLARAVDDGDGLHVRYLWCSPRDDGGRVPRRTHRRLVAPRRAASSALRGLATALAGIAVAAGLPALSPRGPRSGMVRSIESSRGFLRHADGVPRGRGKDPLLHLERPFFKDPVDSFFPGFVVDRAWRVAVRCAMVSRAAGSCRRISRADAPSRRDAASRLP